MTDPSGAAAAKNFTRWQMEWIKALNGAYSGAKLRVAIDLILHANSRTRRIFPSQKRLATRLGCHLTTVERAVADLAADGVVEVDRRDKTSVNTYRFVEEKRQAMMEETAARETKARSRPEDVPDPALLRGQHVHEPAAVRGRDPAPVLGKHSEGTLLEEEHSEAARTRAPTERDEPRKDTESGRRSSV